VYKGLIQIQTIFFGANDAVLPSFYQYVPLEQFKENLRAIVEHPAMRAQNPRILVLTTPPVNEYKLVFFDAAHGYSDITRTASNTKRYAEACREVADSLQLPVVDIWGAFMKAAGWEEGQPLAGSLDNPRNGVLDGLLTDGA
jgi:isoamyl acetate esterase